MWLPAVELNVCSDRFRFALPVDGISDDQDRYMVIVIKSSAVIRDAMRFRVLIA